MNKKKPYFNAVGQEYHGFRVTRIVDIPELCCYLVELVHESSGAQVMYIGNDDPENLFCLSFQTTPTTSNGVAHILEHTVLCGSKKFPAKDPFFSMQRRSLNTFMNALTGADFTCYPAATQVPKDFYNLLDVYIDAVFHPNLNELSFMQEGHRLEFSDPSNSASPLEYKGVVFNEMKGALSSSSVRLNEVMNRELFPDLTYGINSGGDPKNIPSLTYEQLREFHQQFYHPSRCLFFFYGNMPLEQHLDFINKQVLSDVIPLPALPPIPSQPRFSKPRRVTEYYPISEEEEVYDQALVSFGWLTCHILDQDEILALNILELVLMDNDASPLKMALLKSGLCKQASCYMDSEISEVPLVITLKGCNEASADVLESLIQETLHKIIEQGIPLSSIENAIHQLEFHRSEITGDHAPFGLSLFMRSALLKQHGGQSEDGLKVHSLFDDIRRRNLENPHYFGSLIKKYMIDNPHFVRVVLVPKKELGPAEAAEERAVLDAIKEKLTLKEKNALVAKAAELAAFQTRQEDEENVDILPKLTLEDVPRIPRDFSLHRETHDNITIFSHHCFTNEIVYADLIFDLPELKEEDLSIARLLTTIMTQVGCDGRSYVENLDYIQANTGGIGASMTFNLQATDSTSFSPSLYVRGKALYRKAGKLFSLMGEMTHKLDFTDIPRLKELVLKQYSALQGGLNQNALKYAINLSASGLDIPSKIANHWYGLRYYKEIEKIAKNFDLHAHTLVDSLNRLKEKMLGVGKPHLVITCDAEMYDQIKQHKFYGLQHLQTNSYTPWKGDYPLEPVVSQGRVISSPVAFMGKVIKTVSYTHPDASALSIAAFLLENLSLHTSLREQGGAYGGGASNSPMTANFYFYSYRDPNILSSLAAFDRSLSELVDNGIDPQDLEEAKLEMIQGLDMPVAPGSRGDIAYGWMREGKTLAVRQAFRNQVLSLTEEDVIGAVKRHVIPNMSSATTAVFACRELLDKENNKFIAQGLPPLLIEKT
ncbi:MAG: insulinase family protein [Parachlamydiaceae bacterium]